MYHAKPGGCRDVSHSETYSREFDLEPPPPPPRMSVCFSIITIQSTN